MLVARRHSLMSELNCRQLEMPASGSSKNANASRWHSSKPLPIHDERFDRSVRGFYPNSTHLTGKFKAQADEATRTLLKTKEQETGIEPATSSLGKWTVSENKGFSQLPANENPPEMRPISGRPIFELLNGNRMEMGTPWMSDIFNNLPGGPFHRDFATHEDRSIYEKMPLGGSNFRCHLMWF